MFLTFLGIECSLSWTIISSVMAVAAFILPYFFVRYFSKQNFRKVNMIPKIYFFNILEYIFIQASLIPLFTNGQSLCYGSGGQNGLELVFTAELSLPILIFLSWVFDMLHKKQLEQQTEINS